MLAALELPGVPFHVPLTTCTIAELQDIIAQGHNRFAEATSVGSLCTPTVSDVCEALLAFYRDRYAQHLKQDWIAKALTIPNDRRHDMQHIAEMFNTATEDFFLHGQHVGIKGTPLSNDTLAT